MSHSTNVPDVEGAGIGSVSRTMRRRSGVMESRVTTWKAAGREEAGAEAGAGAGSEEPNWDGRRVAAAEETKKVSEPSSSPSPALKRRGHFLDVAIFFVA